MDAKTRSRFFCLFLLLLLLAGAEGCATYGKVIFEDETGAITVEVDKGPGKGRYESTVPRIPPGHMPPPGQCRIWLPGKPPGQQPPPGDCRELERQLPPGAWLIRG